MSRRIRRTRKKHICFSFGYLKKKYIVDDNLQFHQIESVHTCGYSDDAKKYGCIAQIEYDYYNWGVTKEGKVHFCCPRQSFHSSDFSEGDDIMTKLKPALEKLLRKK